ncbi:hypothetical protein BJF78_06400 [Pseudonocardia sp. CNS-139]|nr:hypothetical protein BJF78_06400 [Pseudonocardia sp. CNS-139]
MIEKGFAHTTARDIVAASGTNLASIGYHFGSKEALLNAAGIDSFDDWDDAIDGAMAAREGDRPDERPRALLAGVLQSMGEHRPMVVASVQAFAQAEFSDDVREQIATSYRGARRSFAALLLGLADDEVDDHAAATVGSLGIALVNGLVLQHLVDPADTPSADDVVEAVRALSGRAADDLRG